MSTPHHRLQADDWVSSISFPYKASPEVLPAPLPTTDQIEQSKEVLLDTFGRKVVGFGPHFVIKYGGRVNLEEGRTMMFVRENTSVPVPRVYALFNKADTSKSYIIMERIHGKSLADAWSSLSRSEKQWIAAQLREHLQNLHGLHSRTYRSVANQPLRDEVFWTGDQNVNLAGPFKSDSELKTAIVEIYKLNNNAHIKGKADYCERMFSSELRSSKPVFTHGDLQRKNIILQNDSSSKKRIVIVDWETAGFYPEYWEYARAYQSIRFTDDWESYICGVLSPLPREHNMLRIVFRDLFV